MEIAIMMAVMHLKTNAKRKTFFLREIHSPLKQSKEKNNLSPYDLDAFDPSFLPSWFET